MRREMMMRDRGILRGSNTVVAAMTTVLVAMDEMIMTLVVDGGSPSLPTLQ
jgi:hypothetical protein